MVIAVVAASTATAMICCRYYNKVSSGFSDVAKMYCLQLICPIGQCAPGGKGL